jgi:hypothetical protein
MTEAEWLASDDPVAMLELMRGKVSDRKLRLFVVAFWRWQATRLEEEEYRADLLRRVGAMEAWADAGRLPTGFRKSQSRNVIFFAEAFSSAHKTATAPLTWREGNDNRRACVVRLLSSLRDVFGNPFRSLTSEPAWRSQTVTDLAQAAYDNHILPGGDLDPARLCVLSDALEEAGCTDDALLTHLRSPGPHVRGCWALDLILGRS